MILGTSGSIPREELLVGRERREAWVAQLMLLLLLLTSS